MSIEKFVIDEDDNIPSWNTIQRALHDLYPPEFNKNHPFELYYNGESNRMEIFRAYFTNKDLRNMKHFETLQVTMNIVDSLNKIRYLCQHCGLNINAQNQYGHTLYHSYRMSYDRIPRDLVLTLIDLGFDFSLKDNNGTICNIYEDSRSEMISWMKDTNFSCLSRLPYSVDYLLEKLSHYNIYNFVDMLNAGYRFSTTIERKITNTKCTIQPYLRINPDSIQPEVFDYLLRISHPLCESMFYMTKHNEQWLRQLLDYNYRPSIEDVYFLCSNITNIHILYSYGVDIYPQGKHSILYRFLSEPVTESGYECIVAILNLLSNINLPMTNGNTCLHEIVSFSLSQKRMDVLKLILAKGGDVNITNNKGYDVLDQYLISCHVNGILNYHPDIICLFLDHGGNVNMQTRKGDLLSLFCNSQEDVTPLLERGFDVNYNNNTQKIDTLLKNLATKPRSYKIEVTKLLLQYGLNVYLPYRESTILQYHRYITRLLKTSA